MTGEAHGSVIWIDDANANASVSPLLPLLEARLAIVLRGRVTIDVATRWAEGVARARHEWTTDFGGEQHSLGRAFYTHLEQDRLADYFADARRSDLRVEAAAPGLQEAMRGLVRRVTGGNAVARADFCGAGVHVFPAHEKVATEGGVVHFDTEGLPARHVMAQKRALSVVLMLQAPETGGGLTLWNIVRDPSALDESVDDDDLEAAERALVRTRPGDVVIFDSFRLHQIEGFGGDRDRISATLHAAETLRGTWETWF